MRLDKLLHEAGFGSRNQVKKLIRSQQVKVDGRPALKDNLNLDPDLQEITVAGQALCLPASSYFILHKPAGVVTARKDSRHQTVLDLLDKQDKNDKIYPLGRLDRDTEGLVILTDNGPLGYRLLHPSRHISKTYYVEVNGPLAQEAVAFFQEGVAFDDGTVCKSAQLTIMNSAPQKSSAQVQISEGKFHQVKKMFLAYGVKVTYLKRIAFGDFHLPKDLTVGSYRPFNQQEREILKTYLD